MHSLSAGASPSLTFKDGKVTLAYSWTSNPWPNLEILDLQLLDLMPYGGLREELVKGTP